MPVTINGTTGVAGVDGSASTPAMQGSDTNTGLFFPAADTTAIATGGTERMRIDSSGNVGVGTTSPSSYVGYTALTINGTDSDIDLLRGGVRQAAIFTSATACTFGSIANIPMNLGANSNFFAVLGTDQSFTIKGTGGLGYGTGSGGAVTQATSRTTGVTLNKTNGAITMVSAAGSTTAATFTVTNSTVAATDTIVLSVKSSTNKYNMEVTAVAAGSFDITFHTFSGTSTDAPVINFSVIKAVTS